MPFIFKPNPLQGAFLFKPSEGGSFVMSLPKSQFILNSNKTGATGDKGDKGDTGVVDASFPLVYDSFARSLSITPNYYYLASNPSGFITNAALAGYATENWVTSQNYLVSSDLVGYATQSWVNAQGYLTSADLTGYATEAWVDSQGYLVSSDLTPYLLTSTAAATYYPISNPAGYITNASLSGYATESWVLGKNYITSAALTPYLLTSTAASTYYPLTNPSGYITSSALTPYLLSSTAASTYQPIGDYATNSYVNATFQPLSGMSSYYLASNPDGFITSAALGGYATESWVASQGYLTAPYNPFDQSLNKGDTPTFQSVTLGDISEYTYRWNGASAIGGLYYAGVPIVSIDGLGIDLSQSGMRLRFPDSTVQTTAWTGVINAPTGTINNLYTGDIAGGNYVEMKSNGDIELFGLATIVGYLTTADADSTYFRKPTGTTLEYVRGDGVLSTLSTDVLAAIPDASTTVQGNVQLATKTDAQSTSNATLAVTPYTLAEGLYRALALHKVTWLNGTMQTQTTGTGWTYSQANTYVNIVGAANVAGFARGYVIVPKSNPKYPQVAQNGFWSMAGFFSQSCYVNTSASYAGLYWFARLGEVNSPMAGVALPENPTNTQKVVGVKYAVGSSVRLQVANGTTYTEVDTGYTPANASTFYAVVSWDGLGNATLEVYHPTGKATATTNAAPTGNAFSAVSNSFVCQLAGTGANTAAANFVNIHPVFGNPW